MRRREFIAGLGGAGAWPLKVRAQQPALPVIGYLAGGSAVFSARFLAAFRKGLGDTGYVEGQNVTVEYHWLEHLTKRSNRRLWISHDGTNRIQRPNWYKGASHEWGSLIPTICANVSLRQSKPVIPA